jgi:hypothetical protein
MQSTGEGDFPRLSIETWLTTAETCQCVPFQARPQSSHGATPSRIDIRHLTVAVIQPTHDMLLRSRAPRRHIVKATIQYPGDQYSFRRLNQGRTDGLERMLPFMRFAYKPHFGAAEQRMIENLAPLIEVCVDVNVRPYARSVRFLFPKFRS